MSSSTEVPTEVKICPACGRKNLPLNPRCFNCDAAIHDVATTPSVPERVRCTACGAANDAARESCDLCSASLASATPIPAVAPPPRSDEPTAGSGLSTFGWLLCIVGLLGLIVGLFLGTTVESGSTYLLGSEVGGASIHNVGKITRKISVLIASGFTATVGAVLIAAAEQRNVAARLAAVRET